MGLSYWWLGVPLFLLLGWYTWRVLRMKFGVQKTDVPLANVQLVTQLAAYRQAFKKYQLFHRVLMIFLALTMALFAVLAMRPVAISTIEPELHNRDIMLCLDVSGSMRDLDAKILNIYGMLTDGFKGERIGLTIFDSSAVTVFPLTDDYSFVKEQLHQQEVSINDYTARTLAGVDEGKGSSLIGDGLASCILRFDSLDSKRSRSVILATDNQLNGNPFVTIQEAAALAREKSIRVYGINPFDFSTEKYQSAEAKEYKAAVLSTQGNYYSLKSGDSFSATIDPAMLRDVVAQITKQDATRFKGSPRRVEHDQPTLFIFASSVVFAAYLGLMWRLDE